MFNNTNPNGASNEPKPSPFIQNKTPEDIKETENRGKGKNWITIVSILKNRTTPTLG